MVKIPPKAAADPSARSNGADIMRALEHLPHDAGFSDDLESVNQMDRIPENPWA